jgi:hypothetical protein
MQIDGRRSVADLARERGLLRTLKQLARLSQLKLARIEAPNGPSPTSPEWQPQANAPAQRPAQAQPQLEPPAQPTEQQPSPRSGGSTWQRWRGGSS